MAAEKSEDVKRWHEVLIDFFEKFKDQMSERQQKVYKHYLIDNYDIVPSSITYEDELDNLRETFDKMECACHDEKSFKGFYNMFTCLVQEWFRMYPQGEYKYLRMHQAWMHDCLNSPKENELLDRVASLKKELYDRALIDARNMEKITEPGDIVGRLEHKCMLARHMIWSLNPYNAETVSALIGFFYLCEMAQNAYAETFDYPIYIDQLPASLHALVADKDKFTRWAHAINGPIRKLVGDKYELWDNVCFYARVDGFMPAKLSRQNAATLLFAMCPKIGTESADLLYYLMAKGPKTRKVEDYDELPEDSELKKFCKTLLKFL